MADPLTLLREYTCAGKTAVLQGNDILINERRFPRTTETNYRSRSEKHNFYTLDAVWFLLQNREIRHATYMQMCSRQKFPIVSMVDRKDLLAFVTGEIATSSNVVAAPELPPLLQPLPLTSSQPAERKRSADLGVDDRIEKRTAHAGEEQESARPLDVKTILAQERTIQTRITILQSQRRSFSHVLALAESAKKQQGESSGKGQQVVREKERQADKAAAHAERVNDRYRVQEREVWRQSLGSEALLSEFDIQTTGGYLRDSVEMEASATKVPSRKGANMPAKTASGTRGASSSKGEAKKRGPLILLVPAAIGSQHLINMYNALEFLERGTFVPPAEMKAKQGIKKESQITFRHTMPSGSSRTFQILDNPTKLEASDWEQVVGAFLQNGNQWEFKSWPWPNPTDCLAHVPGFYLQYDDEKTPEAIRQLSVQQLKIHRHRRHWDSSRVLEFWDCIDLHVASKKPHLA